MTRNANYSKDFEAPPPPIELCILLSYFNLIILQLFTMFEILSRGDVLKEKKGGFTTSTSH